MRLIILSYALYSIHVGLNFAFYAIVSKNEIASTQIRLFFQKHVWSGSAKFAYDILFRKFNH